MCQKTEDLVLCNNPLWWGTATEEVSDQVQPQSHPSRPGIEYRVWPLLHSDLIPGRDWTGAGPVDSVNKILPSSPSPRPPEGGLGPRAQYFLRLFLELNRVGIYTKSNLLIC